MIDYSRRDLVLGMSAAVTAAGVSPLTALADTPIRMRIWPGDDNTRVSIESSRKFKFTSNTLRGKKPYRLILDIEGAVLTVGLENQVKKLKLDDKFIGKVRVGQYKKNVLRFVFDLKNDVKTDVRYSRPVANYQHRIILDITPTNADVMGRLIETTDFASSPSAPSKPDTVKETQSRPRSKKPTPKNNNQKSETCIIVIDPGHGGEDPGAVGRRKTYEKTVVLSIAKKLAALINREKNMKAVLTRNKDVFLPLSKRAGIAVKQKAHLFVSIHADAWTNTQAQGSSVYTLGESSSLETRWLAQTQNRSDEIGGIAFKEVDASAQLALVDMLAEIKLLYGRQIGKNILDELAKLGPLHKSGVEFANFAVLKAQGIPSILVETAFLSNPQEERRLRDERHQNKLANAIFAGIRNSFKERGGLFRQS